MNDYGRPGDEADDNLKQKLIKRVIVAGGLIALLLAALAVIDHLGRVDEDGESSGQMFNAPVPVGQRQVSKHLKPADPVIEQLTTTVAKDEPSVLERPSVSAVSNDPAETASAGAGGNPQNFQNQVSPPNSSISVAPPVRVRPPTTERREWAPAAENAATQPSLPAQSDQSAQKKLSVKQAKAATAEPVTETPVLPPPRFATRRPSIPSGDSEDSAPQIAQEVESSAAPLDMRVPKMLHTNTAQEEPHPRPISPRAYSGYTVQAGVFGGVQDAEELVARLSRRGIHSSLDARVLLGPFKTREEAEAARFKLKELGIKGVLQSPRASKN